ncbi:MAG: GNAT family N-acetyltransferase [Phormidesmis sp.]
MSSANAERAVPPSYQWQPFRIRSAQRKDLPQIVAVLLASFYPQAQATQWLYWLMRIGIQEDIKTRLKTPANQYACLVAIFQGKGPAIALETDSAQSTGEVVGTAEISQRPCETWRFLPPKRAYLSNLAIEASHRRQGAANQLIATCETIAMSWGYRRIYLHVMANNSAAQALYAQAGYRPCEVSNPILAGLGLRPERLLLSKSLN